MTSDRQLTPGVLGGMGPAATIDFMARVLALTDARSDQDHLRMLVEQNPKVPSRQRAIRENDPEVPRVLADMARRLERAGADFLVMPCNSAHAFVDAIRQATRIPFISIIEETVDELRRLVPGGRRVGLLATDGLLECGIFQRALAGAGYDPVLPDPRQLDRLMGLIHRVKAGDAGRAVTGAMVELVRALVESGAEAVVAGCTEIPLVLREGDVSVRLVSSTDVLARRTVELATGAAPLP